MASLRMRGPLGEGTRWLPAAAGTMAHAWAGWLTPSCHRLWLSFGAALTADSKLVANTPLLSVNVTEAQLLGNTAGCSRSIPQGQSCSFQSKHLMANTQSTACCSHRHVAGFLTSPSFLWLLMIQQDLPYKHRKLQ